MENIALQILTIAKRSPILKSAKSRLSRKIVTFGDDLIYLDSKEVRLNKRIGLPQERTSLELYGENPTHDLL